ncbi:MAG: site-specific integrase, partial [Balneolaceae bacterium]
MEHVIGKYLRTLKIERNASPHTILSYGTDLRQFHAFLVARNGAENPDLNDVDRLAIRLWLGALSDDGLAKSTIAR